MARLLVSVRSPEEARDAALGGADVIDVKEPAHGPLGRAEASVWRAVRAAVGPGRVLSVALGELHALSGHAEGLTPADFEGYAYRKLGLARSGPDWAEVWARLRTQLGDGPRWVAVAYADWSVARAPHPDAVLDAALALSPGECPGLLVDTWDKSAPSPVGLGWAPWFERARAAGRFTALAGRVDRRVLERLAPLRPDLIAVRGAVCLGGDRRAAVCRDLVADLARAVAALEPAPSARAEQGPGVEGKPAEQPEGGREGPVQ